MPRADLARLLPAVLALAGASGAGGRPGPQPEHRPEAGQRIARLFDFEEASTNPLPVPRHWSRLAEDPGEPPGTLPPFNRVELDYTTAFGGGGSVMLRARAGAVVLRLDPGVIPVFPGGDYMVSARVRTSGLEHDRAFVTARFLDEHAAPLAASEQRTRPIASEGGWTEVVLHLRGRWPQAAFLQLDLSLEPPRRFEPGAAEPHPHRAWLQDADARAWFDDVMVVQLPRLEVTTGRPGNVVVAPARPAVSVFLRDLAGESMHARVTVRDALGAVADATDMPVPGGNARLTWEPDLTRLGWYRVDVEVRNADRPMGRAGVDFVLLPAPGQHTATPASDSRLGLSITSAAPAQWADLPALVEASGAAWASLPVWGESLTPEDMPGLLDAVRGVLTRLRQEGRGVEFSLPRVPRSLAARTRAAPDNPAAAIAAPGDAWKPLLLPLLDEHGQSVLHWEVGAGAGSTGLAPSGEDVAALRRVIAALVPGPVVALGWHAQTPLEALPRGSAGAPDGLHVFVPRSEPVTETVERVRRAADPQGRGRPALRFILDPGEGAFDTPSEAADDLFRRVVLALAAGAPQVGVVSPWTWTDEPLAQTTPTAPLAAFRTLADALRQRRVAERLPIGPGVVCHVLDPAPGTRRSGAVVLWSQTPEPVELVVPLSVGPVTLIDTWGNVSHLSPLTGKTGAVSPHALTVASSPVVVEGADTALLRFLASLRVEPSFLSTDETEHHVALHVVNTWGSEITGSVLVREPAGAGAAEGARREWTISPRTQRFGIAAGGAAALPLTLAFSPSQEAGPHDLRLEIGVEGPRVYSGLTASVPVVVGLRGVSLDLTCRAAPGPEGPDLLVEAVVTNASDHDATLEVIAFAPGRPRAGTSPASLGPGERTSRQFAFPGGAAALRGQRIFVSVRDADRGSRLTRSVLVE